MPKPSDTTIIPANVIDVVSARPASSKAATHFAEATINGHRTTVRANLEDAKANGWDIIGPIAGEPRHKSRTAAPPAPPAPPSAPSAPSAAPSKTKAEPEPIGPEEEREALLEALDGFTVPELREQADELGLEGTSKLRKAELIELLIVTKSAE